MRKRRKQSYDIPSRTEGAFSAKNGVNIPE